MNSEHGKSKIIIATSNQFQMSGISLHEFYRHRLCCAHDWREWVVVSAVHVSILSRCGKERSSSWLPRRKDVFIEHGAFVASNSIKSILTVGLLCAFDSHQRKHFNCKWIHHVDQKFFATRNEGNCFSIFFSLDAWILFCEFLPRSATVNSMLQLLWKTNKSSSLDDRIGFDFVKTIAAFN